MLTKYDKYRLIYSPRTSMSNIREREEKLFNDLGVGFEPNTIEIMKKHLKERLGVVDKITFISIVKRHLDKWHPELANREEILVKLLSRLFDQIDLNSNGDLEWSEFMNYIVNNSFEKNFQKASNTLQQYAISRNKLSITGGVDVDENDKDSLFSMYNQNVSYCFYIQKHKLIGIVQENKSTIIFYNIETNKKEGKEINLIKTQEEIDKFEINELEHKTQIKLRKESEKAKILLSKKKEEFINFKNRNRTRNGFKENYTSFKTMGNNNHQNQNINNKQNERIPTPPSIRKELRIIRGNNFFIKNKRMYKLRKLMTLTTFFVDEYDLLFVSSSNNKISAWKYDIEINSFKNVNSSYFSSEEFIFSYNKMNIPIFSCTLPQYTICFDSVTNRLYSGQEDGKILVWTMNSSKPKNILFLEEKDKNNRKNSLNKYDDKNIGDNNIFMMKDSGVINTEENSKKQNINHNHKRDTVSCLLILNKLRLLCSSYYNGKIILWDVATKKPKKIINEQKTGIYQFVFDPFKNYLYTCGFDHNIYVYDPYNEESSIYQLKGHNSSVKSLSLNLEGNELVSIDINGNLKIWDTTYFINFQTLNIYNSILSEQNHAKKQLEQFINKNKIVSNIHVLYLSNFKKIIVYGEKFVIYEKGKTKNPNLCDDNLILGSIYNHFQNDLITFSSKRVKLWDIYTGKVKIIFESPMEGGEITSFAHDRQMKRFYIGDNLGKIKNFNLSTGGFLKSFISHQSEIVDLIHSSEYEFLISCSSDLVIKFQNDAELTTTELIKEINMNYLFSSISQKEHITIRDVKFNEEDNELLIALSNIWISFYDVKHYKFSTLLNMRQESILKTTSITCIEDLKKVNMIFVLYENGKKCFLAKPKNKYYVTLALKRFGHFSEKKYLNNEEYVGTGVCSQLDEEENNLFIGDHLGFINIYNLKELDAFMKKKFKNDDEIQNYAVKELVIDCNLRIKAHIESIKYISIPKDLKPKIILSTGNDRNVKLFSYETGEYIDSLKQISIKHNPIPIAIQYIKNNPFLEDVKDIEKKSNIELYDTDNIIKLYNKNHHNTFIKKMKVNNRKSSEVNESNEFPKPEICTIYRHNIIKKKLKLPEFDPEYIPNNNAFMISNNILEYNAKVKLYNLSLSENVPHNRSTLWNYDIDINFILNKKKEDINELISEVKKKEKEIIETEINHENYDILSPDYNPIFIKNLDEEQKKDLIEIINEKIKNIKLAISRSCISKYENECMRKLSNYNVLNKSPEKKKLNINEKTKSTNKKSKKKFNFTMNEFNQTKGSKNSSKRNNSIESTKSTFMNPLKTMSNFENKKYKRQYNDIRIEKCLNQFETKLFELQKPFELLYNNKNIKRNILPKINQNIFTNFNKDK